MFEADLDFFFQDMAVDVVSGSVTFKGILDMPDEFLSGGVFTSRDYQLTVKTMDVASLAQDAVLVISGTSYTVRSINLISDGALSVLTLGPV